MSVVSVAGGRRRVGGGVRRLTGHITSDRSAVFRARRHLVFAAMSEDTPRAGDNVPADAPSPGPVPPTVWAPPTPADLPPRASGGSTAPSASPTPAGSARSWWSRTAAGLPVGAWLGVAVVAIGGIVAGAVALGDDDGEPKLAIDITNMSTPEHPPTEPDRAPRTAPVRTAPDNTVGGTPAAPPDTVPDTGPDTTSGAAPQTAPDSAPPESRPARPAVDDGSEPTGPLPAGDPESSRFEYADPFGSEWSGTIGGVVEVPLLWEDESAVVRCFVVIGTLTPEAVDGIVSDSWSTPYLTLFVDGEEAELSDATCATDELAAAGYRSMFDANVTLGTEFAFYTEFSLAESAGDPQAVAVSQGDDASGDASQDDAEWLFFDATLLDEVAPVEVGAVGPLPVEPEPISDGVPGAFQHADDYTGDGWSGSILGLVEVPTDAAAGLPGRCFAVIGTLTADSAGSGVLTSPYAAPPIALIADGRLIDDYYGCSNVEAETAGYHWFNDAEVTPGTSIAVYATLVVPQPLPGHVQAILVGDPWGDAPTVLAAHVLEGFAAVAPTPGPPPGGELTPTATPFSVAQELEAANWDAIVHGHVPTDSGTSDEPGVCVVVLASFTLGVGSSEPLPPEVFLVAGGRLLPEDFDCDTEPARTAGYVEQWSQGGRVGQSIHVYAGFRIPPELGPPQAVVVGRGGLGDQVVVAPTELDAIPPIPG